LTAKAERRRKKGRGEEEHQQFNPFSLCCKGRKEKRSRNRGCGPQDLFLCNSGMLWERIASRHSPEEEGGRKGERTSRKFRAPLYFLYFSGAKHWRLERRGRRREEKGGRTRHHAHRLFFFCRCGGKGPSSARRKREEKKEKRGFGAAVIPLFSLIVTIRKRTDTLRDLEEERKKGREEGEPTGR